MYSRINPVKLWKTAFKNFEEIWSAYLWKTAFKNFTWSIHEYLDPNNYSYGKNTWKRCDICSKLTIKTQNDINDAVLISLLLTFNILHIFF